MTIEFTPNHYNANTDATCGNCDHVERAGNCNPIKDPGMRLCTGDPLPAGECTQCGSLSYAPDRTTSNNLIDMTLTLAEYERKQIAMILIASTLGNVSRTDAIAIIKEAIK